MGQAGETTVDEPLLCFELDGKTVIRPGVAKE